MQEAPARVEVLAVRAQMLGEGLGIVAHLGGALWEIAAVEFESHGIAARDAKVPRAKNEKTVPMIEAE